MCVVKTKGQIICAVTAQLFCFFVFASAKIWFYPDVAQIMQCFIRLRSEFMLYS